MRQIESNQVMAEQEVNAIGQAVQLDESSGRAGAMRAGKRLLGVGPYAGKGADAGVSDADLKIKGEASEPGVSVAVQHKRGCSLKSRKSRYVRDTSRRRRRPRRRSRRAKYASPGKAGSALTKEKRHLQPRTPAILDTSDRQDVDLSVPAKLETLKDVARTNGCSVADEHVDEAERADASLTDTSWGR